MVCNYLKVNNQEGPFQRYLRFIMLKSSQRPEPAARALPIFICIRQIAGWGEGFSHWNSAVLIFCPWKFSSQHENSPATLNKAEELVQTSKLQICSSLTSSTSEKLGGWKSCWSCGQQISPSSSALAELQGQLYTWMNCSGTIFLMQLTQTGFPLIPGNRIPVCFFCTGFLPTAQRHFWRRVCGQEWHRGQWSPGKTWVGEENPEPTSRPDFLKGTPTEMWARFCGMLKNWGSKRLLCLWDCWVTLPEYLI